MENKIRNVSLSFCCKEDWNAFSCINDKARFCKGCKHSVVDFTNASQSDFNQLMHSGQQVCGRFKQSQMSETFLKMAAASLVIAAATTTIGYTQQENVVPNTQREEANEIMLVGIIEPPILLDSVSDGRPGIPIIVGDAPKGEQPIRYDPWLPSNEKK